MRAKYGYLTYGENVDNALIEKFVPVKVFGRKSCYRPDKELLDALPEDLRKEFYTCGREVDDLDAAVLDALFTEFPSDSDEVVLQHSRQLLISRFGLSFAAVMLSPNLYCVLDSHVRQVGWMKRDAFIEYIKMGADSFYGVFLTCIGIANSTVITFHASEEK